jgi:hypothetical protein
MNISSIKKQRLTQVQVQWMASFNEIDGIPCYWNKMVDD